MTEEGKIKVESQFANLLYKDFKSKKFGITPCCNNVDMASVLIKKRLCDWQDLENEVLTPSTGLTITIIDCDAI